MPGALPGLPGPEARGGPEPARGRRPEVPSLRTVDPATGQATPLALEVAEGPTSEIADFDVSPGGRWLAVVEVDRRGDVWLLEASKGSF